jgi:GT2 family glycosyltransferase
MAVEDIKKLCISVISYNGLSFLKECLDSLLSYPPDKEYEILVVDNASSDGSPEFIKNSYPQIKLIINNVNIGFAAANNQAIKSSKSEYVLLINSDCKVYKDSLNKLIEFMDSVRNAGVIGPKIINSDGSIQFSCRKFPSILNAGFHSILTNIAPNNPFSRKYKLVDINRDNPFEVDWVSGSCMLIRRDALDDAGFMDEHYFMYVEDVDLCYQMWKKNWKVFYFPHSEILHHIGGSTSDKKLKASFRMQKSIFYFFWKNYKKSWKILLIPFLIIVLGLRIFLTFLKGIFNRND